MLDKYKTHFSKYCNEENLSEKIQSSVDHYFKNLSQTIKFFQDFRTIAKELNEKKLLNAKAYALFIKNTVSDYKRKLKPEEQEVVVQKYNNFVDWFDNRSKSTTRTSSRTSSLSLKNSFLS